VGIGAVEENMLLILDIISIKKTKGDQEMQTAQILPAWIGIDCWVKLPSLQRIDSARQTFQASVEVRLKRLISTAVEMRLKFCRSTAGVC
jgi:hypothetical protein